MKKSYSIVSLNSKDPIKNYQYIVNQVSGILGGMFIHHIPIGDKFSFLIAWPDGDNSNSVSNTATVFVNQVIIDNTKNECRIELFLV